jgi:hypothetical protein
MTTFRRTTYNIEFPGADTGEYPTTVEPIMLEVEGWELVGTGLGYHPCSYLEKQYIADHIPTGRSLGLSNPMPLKQVKDYLRELAAFPGINWLELGDDGPPEEFRPQLRAIRTKYL